MKEFLALIIAEFLAVEIFSYKNILDRIKDIANYLKNKEVQKVQKIREMLDDIEKTKNSEEIIDIMEKVIMCHAMELKEENEKK